MTKKDLINQIHNGREDITKTAVTDIIDGVFDLMAKTLKKDKRFSYAGFGTWTVRSRKARKGRNPQTGEQIKIKASRTVAFKPAPKLKGLV